MTPSTNALPMRPSLTLERARAIVDAATRDAQARSLRVSIAVVDDGGHLLHFARMDGIHPATVEVAMAKARTAALFRKPTEVFAKAVAEGQTAIATLPNMLPLPGGLPLNADGQCVGAIGISGAAPDVDAAIAAAGAAGGDAS